MRTGLSKFLRDHYEVAVIGGGVNGAGIAEALAAAGYTVLLLERNDFGSGTTSRSTRLVHGGLRYLEHGEFGLVYESLRERAALLELYPHLVKPLRLLLPLYKGGAYPRWKARSGLALYDLLSLGRGLGRHESLSGQQALQREPRLSSSGLSGALLFSDAQVDLAERLALECVLAARDLGADVANYAEVMNVWEAGSGLRLAVQDWLEDEEVEVIADVVINSTGPWVDAVLERSDLNRPPLIGGTRGSHIVIPAERVGLKQAIYAPARSDGRPFFVLPWLGMLLVGTTDVRHSTDPDDAQASPAEVAYLLSETNALLNSDLTEKDIVYTYSGVRPLPFEEGVSEGAISRRHFLVDHTSDGLPGAYSLVGGKLTTFRSVGRKAVRLVSRRLGERWPITREAQAAELDSPPSFKQLWGRRAAEVYERYRQEDELTQPICEHSPEPKAAIVEAVDRELASTIADVFLRRTSVGWRSCQGHHVAALAADLIGRRLGWDESRRSVEVARYLVEAAGVHPGVAESERLASAAAP